MPRIKDRLALANEIIQKVVPRVRELGQRQGVDSSRHRGAAWWEEGAVHPMGAGTSMGATADRVSEARGLDRSAGH